MLISIAMSMLPSRYAIGAEVYFHPDGWMFEHAGRPLKQALKAKIVSVRFTSSKVLYDLALLCRQTDSEDRFYDEYYEAIPLRDVDSTFVFQDDIVREPDPKLVARLAELPSTFIPQIVPEPEADVPVGTIAIEDVGSVVPEPAKKLGFFNPDHIFNPDTFDKIFNKPVSLEKSAPIRLSI